MNTVKRILYRVFDVAYAPLTLLAALHMRALRRFGVFNFPVASRILHALGVFPIRRHYYEPLWHPGDLRLPLKTPRSLPGLDLNEEGQLSLLAEFRYEAEIARFGDTANPLTFSGHVFHVNNERFGPGDIDFYYSMIRHLKPGRIVEIGSGFSTMIALHALEANQREEPAYRCILTAIEPYPWFRDDRLELLAVPLEAAPRALFDGLHENDILFIDSSHMIRPQGDVLMEYLEILPTLAPGVVVHIHDIFTPFDYPELWVKIWQALWNEQYLVEAFLTQNPHFEIIGALAWLHATQREPFDAKCPLLAHSGAQPQSLWIRRKQETRQ